MQIFLKTKYIKKNDKKLIFLNIHFLLFFHYQNKYGELVEENEVGSLEVSVEQRTNGWF